MSSTDHEEATMDAADVSPATTDATANPAPTPPTATAPQTVRERIAVPAQAPPTPGVVKPLGEPLVLIGAPRLESTPRAFPAVPESPVDSVVDGGEVDGLTIRGASLRGDDHRHLAEPRQDSFGVHPLSVAGASLLACVADGVGSQPLSHLGSATVCRVLAREIEPYVAGMLDPARENELNDKCTELAARLTVRLEEEAAARQVAPKQLSTTLAAALVGADRDGHRRTVFFAVGDSPAYVLHDGAFEPAFGTDGEDIAGSPTSALPAAPAAVRMQIADVVRGDVVVLCTDGLSNPMRDDLVRKQLVDWWQTAAPALPGFYWQLSFRAQSYGDDRTAVCVWVS